jgi:hypothetical protein
MKNYKIAVPQEVIMSKIFLIRDEKVMLDSDLANLYQVPTKRLNEQVKRNPDRFPEDFMFQLTSQEWENLKSQNATSRWGGRRSLPYVFTEHGVLMLSSVLSSERAVAVNVQIMRIDTKLRKMLVSQKDLLLKINGLESQLSDHDTSIQQIFACLKALIQEKDVPREPIGFRTHRKR